MKYPNPLRLLVISLVTAVLMVAAFEVAIYVRVQQELHPPPPEATPTDTIRALPGFKVTLLHSATTNEDSWISMTVDPQGRLIISPHAGKLLRMTVAGGKLTKIERLDLPCTDAMGLLYASNSLFLDCNGPQGVGLYRASDLGETFGPPKLLRRLNFWMYEHGAHTVALGPDGKLYLVAGDATELPADLSPASPFHNCAEDQLLARENDPHNIFDQCQPLGGFVLRMDVDGTHCERFAGGGRNNYAVAFNAEGELFGADNDPEWVIGMAWYRPCRITHWVSGGDYGYRQGTGDLPGYDQDTLPSTLDTGLGAPAGVEFAPANCAFPPAYRNALFVEDWAYGRLQAVHFTPRGATYNATVETVLRGTPLTLTSLKFGLDGSLYFITGGRESESGLYRLTYEGPPIPEPTRTKQETANEEAAKAARRLRRQLESCHGRRDPGALEIIWPNLSSQDRWIRYAGRVALEFQDAAGWKDRALAETNVEGGLTALLALARCGGQATQAGLLGALEKFPFSRLTLEQQLFKLRVMEVSFIRQGRPPEIPARRAMETLDALYPAANESLNQELCQLLLYLQAPDAVAKSVASLDKAATQEDQTYYIMRLRNITNGWTLDLRRDYLGWFPKKRDPLAHRPEVLQSFHDVGLDYSDGLSFQMFLDNFLDETAATMSADERKALAAYLPKPPEAAPATDGGKFVKQWRMADLEPDLGMIQWHRSKARGRAIFTRVGCVLCHRFAGHGGSVGPDLTAIGSRSTPRGILESILEPSKVLPEQFQNIVLTTSDGDVLTGRVVREDKQRLFFMTDLIRRTTVELRQEDVLARRASKISPMPEGMVNSLQEDEIWDLIAYLKSGGQKIKIAPPK
jgi:putative heme-binding domain-containing protein